MEHTNGSATSDFYTVILGRAAGFGVVEWRLKGSIPRRLTRQEVARLRATLDRGNQIEILTHSRESWQAMAPSFLAQLGLAS